MISNLSNSFRVLSVYNVAVKSTFVTVQKIPLRDIHLHQPMLKSIEEKLGLSAKPKRPLSPFFRFMRDVRPTVVSKNPKLKAAEVVSTIGKMWKSLDATKKEKYAEGYKENLLVHAEGMAKYKDKLSADDVQQIKEARNEKKEHKAILLQKKKLRSLGRPKKPVSFFIKFVGQQTDRQPKESSVDFLRRVSAKWNLLSNDEKAKYKASEQDEENYKKALLQWEDKMRKEGHFDIVAADSVLHDEQPKRDSPKSSVEEPKRRSPKSSTE